MRVEMLRRQLRSIAPQARAQLWRVLGLVPRAGERAKVISGDLIQAEGRVIGVDNDKLLIRLAFSATEQEACLPLHAVIRSSVG